MQQKTIFSLQGLVVNTTQLIANKQIFALNELISVKHGFVEPKPVFPAICLLIGFCLLILGDGLMIAGGFSILLGLGIFFSSEGLYTIIVETAQGEHTVFVSQNRDAVDSAISKINTAIIDSGAIK